MNHAALGGVGVYCLNCEVETDTISVLLMWVKPEAKGQAVPLSVPKQPDSPAYLVRIPANIETCHSLVELPRVHSLED